MLVLSLPAAGCRRATHTIGKKGGCSGTGQLGTPLCLLSLLTVRFVATLLVLSFIVAPFSVWPILPSRVRSRRDWRSPFLVEAAVQRKNPQPTSLTLSHLASGSALSVWYAGGEQA